MQKHVVIIDYSLAGHHFSFLCSFSKILLNQGYKVSCLVPGSGKIQNWIHENVSDQVGMFAEIEYDYQAVSYSNWGRFNDSLSVLHRWKAEARMVYGVEKKVNQKVDLVFYAWLDNNLSAYIPGWLIDKVFPWRWSGLYFHPYHLRQSDIFLKRGAVWRDHDSVLLAKNCLSVAVHDNGIIADFKQRIGKPVLHFPETADDTRPDEDYPLATKIKGLANGRIIVGLIGCEPHKGTLNLMRAVKKADPTKYFFAFLGIFNPETFPENNQKEINDFVNKTLENCFFHFMPIPEGAEYNAIFSTFDIPYLVYNNFISSSNRLTKAAIFERLVLAQNNYCVGADVKEFDLGEVITPNNPEKVVEGLTKLSIRIANTKFPLEHWKRYRELNSMEKLGQRFTELLTLIS